MNKLAGGAAHYGDGSKQERYSGPAMRGRDSSDSSGNDSNSVRASGRCKRVMRCRLVMLAALLLTLGVAIGLFLGSAVTAMTASASKPTVAPHRPIAPTTKDTRRPAQPPFRPSPFSRPRTSPREEVIPPLSCAADGSSRESLFGLPVEQLAANIRRSYERFNSVEVDQALRRERGPPSYVYGGSAAAQHPEDNIRTVKARFFVYCSKLDDFTRLSALTAALTGIRLECIEYDWKRFSVINRFAPIVGWLMASEGGGYFDSPLDKLSDEDVVTLADADVVYSADADVYSLVRAFASVTAHSAAEHQRMTTRDPREAADSVRWTRYARDVRTGGALAPFLIQGETYCWLQGLGCCGECESHFKNLFQLHSGFLRQQKLRRQQRRGASASAPAPGAAAAARNATEEVDSVNGYTDGDHAVAADGHSAMFRISSGFVMVRVWALRRAYLAAQNLAHTLPACERMKCRYPIPGSPKHKRGAYRTDANDQGYIGILYLHNRLHEYQTGGPLAVDYTSSTLASVLTTTERERVRWANERYDILGLTSHIPSGAPDADGASLRLPHALMAVDWHNTLVQVIHNLNAWNEGHHTYSLNVSWLPQAHGSALRRYALRPYDKQLAQHFEVRRRHTMSSAGSAASNLPPPLPRSFLGNLLNDNMVVFNPKDHSYSCRTDEAEANGTCSSLSFLRAASLITADSPTAFPPRTDRALTRPILWHTPGNDKRAVMQHYLYLLPQLYPLLHPLVNHTRAACELAQLTELLPPVRAWPLVGECGDADAYRGGEGTGRAVTEELIRRSTRELGCLPARKPELLPLGDSGKEAALYWARNGRL